MMVADTDVLIDYLQGKGAVAQRIALELEHTQLCTTAVNRFELQAGARSPRQQKLVRELLEALPCLPLDAVSADRAAEVRRALEQRGQSIGMGDSLIAGITLASKGVLLTRNRQHFARVAGLALGTLGD
jgi:predicted nucleic acid-binding protein